MSRPRAVLVLSILLALSLALNLFLGGYLGGLRRASESRSIPLTGVDELLRQLQPEDREVLRRELEARRRDFVEGALALRDAGGEARRALQTEPFAPQRTTEALAEIARRNNRLRERFYDALAAAAPNLSPEGRRALASTPAIMLGQATPGRGAGPFLRDGQRPLERLREERQRRQEERRPGRGGDPASGADPAQPQPGPAPDARPERAPADLPALETAPPPRDPPPLRPGPLQPAPVQPGPDLPQPTAPAPPTPRDAR